MAAVKKTVLEAALVALIGALLAFTANALSPRGLKLARNYFPGGTNGSVAKPIVAAPSRPAGTNQLSPAELLAARLKQKDLQLIDRAKAEQLFHDPRFEQEMIVFVDARDEEHYQQGHIPDAYELDPYRAEKYLATVLPVCQAAEEVVVYCNGGDCEDSEFAALTLRDAGIANQKLFIYGGDFTEWSTNKLTIEVGARKSGDLRNGSK